MFGLLIPLVILWVIGKLAWKSFCSAVDKPIGLGCGSFLLWIICITLAILYIIALLF